MAAVPPPPTVIYTKGGAARPPASHPLPAVAFPLDPSHDFPPEPHGENFGGLGAGTAPRGETAKVPGVPLGPPPPFRPVAPVPKAAPARAEIATRPPVVAVNNRVLGAIGPPPPYRPIVQTAVSFERGPAPDLEPWRLAELSRILEASRAEEEKSALVKLDPDEDEWALLRLPPEPVVHPKLNEAESAYRVETVIDGGPDDLPLRWPSGFTPPPVLRKQGFFARLFRRSRPVVPYGVAPLRSPRRRRRLIWVAVAGLGVVVLGAGLYVERWKVMRMLPDLSRISGMSRFGGGSSGPPK